MQRKIFFIALILAIVIVNQTRNASAEQHKKLFTVSTRSGSFSLSVPVLRLSPFSPLPLISIPAVSLPELPDWYYSHFIPDDPSWLDQAGKFYKEGVVQLFQGNWDMALRRFRKVTDEYPETPWFAPSWFWQGQILVKREKYAQAVKTLNLFLFALEYSRGSERFVDYQNISRYTLAWLNLKQRKHEEALIFIEKHEKEINDSKIRSQLLFLKYLTYVQLDKPDSAFEVLQTAIQFFPGNFEHFVRLAEFYFRAGHWQKLADLVNVQALESAFYNDSRMEYFLWLGVTAEISLKRWEQAKKLMRMLEELGVRNPDTQALTYLRIHLQTRQFDKAWGQWQQIQDDKIREQSLREIFQNVVQAGSFQFLIGREFDSQFWQTWQGEGQLVLAYAHLRLGNQEKAYGLLQQSYAYESEKDPEYSDFVVLEESLYLRTVIELLSSDLENALLHLRRLLEEYAESERLSDYYFWYGVVLYEQEKTPMPTVMAMRQVDSEGERDDDRLFLLGEVNYDQKQWQAAIQAFLQLSNRHPKSPFLEEAYYLLSQAYFEQKQYDSAFEILEVLRKTFKSPKNLIKIIHLQVRVLTAQKKFEQADDLLRRDIKTHPDFSLIKLRVEVLKYLKDPQRILSVTGLGLGLSTSKDQGFLYFHRANAFYETEKFEEAYTYYKLTLQNPPEDQKRFARYRILKIQHQLRRFSELLKNADSFLKINPEDSYSDDILHLLSNYYLEHNQKEKAVPYWKQLLANYEKSVQKVELAPQKRVEQIVKIGEIYNKLENYKLATRWLNQALSSMNEVKGGKKHWQFRVLREKGFALFMLGKHPQALAANLKVAYLDRSLSQEKKFELNLHIASSYTKLKRVKEAKAIYRKMLKKFTNVAQQNQVQKLLSGLN